METTTVRLYRFGYSEVRTYLVALAFVIGNMALPQMFHIVPQGGMKKLMSQDELPFITIQAAAGIDVDLTHLWADGCHRNIHALHRLSVVHNAEIGCDSTQQREAGKEPIPCFHIFCSITEVAALYRETLCGTQCVPYRALKRLRK